MSEKLGSFSSDAENKQQSVETPDFEKETGVGQPEDAENSGRVLDGCSQEEFIGAVNTIDSVLGNLFLQLGPPPGPQQQPDSSEQ